MTRSILSRSRAAAYIRRARASPQLRRVLRVQVFAVAQQITAALQLGAMLIAVGHSRSTDTYVVLYSASQLTPGVLAIGVLQPLTLNQPGYRSWRQWTYAGLIANALLLFAVAGFLILNAYPTGVTLAVMALLVLSGGAAHVAYVGSVNLAALGKPAFLASVTTLGNVLATLFVFASPVAKVPVMCAGLLIGNVISCFVINRLLAAAEPESFAPGKPARGSDVAGMLAASSAGALGPFAFQAVTATYAAGEATLLGFASRIVAGVVTVGVTAFINATTDWRRRDSAPLRMAVLGITPLLAFSFVSLACMVALRASEAFTVPAAALALLCGSTTQACTGRALAMTGRLAWFRHMAVSNACLYPIGVLVLVVGAHTATLYFTVAGLLTVAGTIVLAGGVGWRRYSFSLCLVCLCAGAIALVGRLS